MEDPGRASTQPFMLQAGIPRPRGTTCVLHARGDCAPCRDMQSCHSSPGDSRRTLQLCAGCKRSAAIPLPPWSHGVAGGFSAPKIVDSSFLLFTRGGVASHGQLSFPSREPWEGARSSKERDWCVDFYYQGTQM